MFQKQTIGTTSAGSDFAFGSTTNTNTTGLFGSAPSTSTGLFGQQNTTLGGGGLFGNTSGILERNEKTRRAYLKSPPSTTRTASQTPSHTHSWTNLSSSTDYTSAELQSSRLCTLEDVSNSLEKLRLEDLVDDRKGAEVGEVFGGFQQTEKPLSGAPSTGLFEATTTQASASGTNTSTFVFGTNTQKQPSEGLYGAEPATSGFGAKPQQTAAPTFGAKPQQTRPSTFRAKSQQTRAPTFKAKQTTAPTFGSELQQTTAPTYGAEPQQTTVPTFEVKPQQTTAPTFEVKPQQTTVPTFEAKPQQTTAPTSGAEPQQTTAPTFDSRAPAFEAGASTTSPRSGLKPNTDTSMSVEPRTFAATSIPQAINGEVFSTTPQNIPPLRFHTVHGMCVRVSDDGTAARRIPSINDNLVFSARPVRTYEKVSFRLHEISDESSIFFGFTPYDPSILAHELKLNASIMNKNGNWSDSLSGRFCKKHNILSYYFDSAGKMHFEINWCHKGELSSRVDTNSSLWALVELNHATLQFIDPEEPQQVRGCTQNPFEERLATDMCSLLAEEVLSPPRYPDPLEPLSLYRTKATATRAETPTQQLGGLPSSATLTPASTCETVICLPQIDAPNAANRQCIEPSAGLFGVNPATLGFDTPAISASGAAPQQTTATTPTSGAEPQQTTAPTSGAKPQQTTAPTSGAKTQQTTALTSGAKTQQTTAPTSGAEPQQTTAQTSGAKLQQITATAPTSGAEPQQTMASTSGAKTQQTTATTSGAEPQQTTAPTSGTKPQQTTATTPTSGAKPQQTTAPTSGAKPQQTTAPTSGAKPQQTTAPTSGAKTQQTTALTSGAKTQQTTAPTFGAEPQQTTAPTSGAKLQQITATAPTSGAEPQQTTASTSGAEPQQTTAPTFGTKPQQTTATTPTSGAKTQQTTASTSGAEPQQTTAPTSGAKPQQTTATTPTSGAEPQQTTAPTSGAKPQQTTAPTSGIKLQQTTAPTSGAKPQQTTATTPTSGAKTQQTTATTPTSGSKTQQTTAPTSGAEPQQTTAPTSGAKPQQTTATTPTSGAKTQQTTAPTSRAKLQQTTATPCGSSAPGTGLSGGLGTFPAKTGASTLGTLGTSEAPSLFQTPSQNTSKTGRHNQYCTRAKKQLAASLARLAELEAKCSRQADELLCLRSTLADVLRKLNAPEERASATTSTDRTTETPARELTIRQPSNSESVERTSSNASTASSLSQRGKDCRGNLCLLPTGEIVYFVAAVVVLFSVDEKCQRHYTEHTGDVTCIAIHPNKRVIASGQCAGHDRNDARPHVRVWNSESLATLTVIDTGHIERTVACLTFSRADGGALLACVDDGPEPTISVWDWQTSDKGHCLAESECSVDTVVAVEFHPLDKNQIVTCGKGHIAFFFWWPNDLYKRIGIFGTRDKPMYVTCLGFNHNGDVISGDSNGNLIVWGRGTNTIHKIVREVHEGAVFSICSLKDGGFVSGGGKDGRLVLFDVDLNASGTEHMIPRHYGGVRVVAEGRDNQLFVSTTKNCILRGDLQLGFVPVARGHVDEVWGLACHPTLRQFASAGHSNVWSTDIEERAQFAARSRDGSAVGCVSGRWLVFQPQCRDLLAQHRDGTEPIQTIQYSPNNHLVAIGSRDNFIYIYQVADEGSRYFRLGNCLGHSSFITHLDWPDDSQYIRSNSGDYELQFFAERHARRELGARDGRALTAGRHAPAVRRRPRRRAAVVARQIARALPAGRHAPAVRRRPRCRTAALSALGVFVLFTYLLIFFYIHYFFTSNLQRQLTNKKNNDTTSIINAITNSSQL